MKRNNAINENELINEYISTIATVGKRKSKHTLTNYESDLVEFEEFVRGLDLKLMDVKKRDIERFQVNLNNKGRATSTIARKLTSIRMFYRFFADSKHIEEDPSERVIIPEIEERNPVYMSLEEATRVIDATKTQNEPYRSRDGLLMVLALTTGLRVEEIANIKLKDIKGSILSVIGKGNKQREVMLNRDVLKAIKDYHKVRKNTTDYLFVSIRGTNMSKRTIQYTADKYIGLAGLDLSIHSIHGLRHTFATLAYKNGVPIRTLQEILGHSSVETTEIYTHVDSEDKQVAANTMVGIFG